MTYKQDRNRKTQLSKIKAAFKKKEKVVDPDAGKNTVLVPHPTIPKTFIQKTID
jgi:hypothetical protein